MSKTPGEYSATTTVFTYLPRIMESGPDRCHGAVTARLALQMWRTAPPVDITFNSMAPTHMYP